MARMPPVIVPGIALYPERAVEQYSEGWEQADGGEYEAATASCDTALDAYPEHKYAYGLRGWRLPCWAGT